MKMTSALERSLMWILHGFKRCHDRFASIYHELWEPQVPIEKVLPDVLASVSRTIGGTTIVIYDEPAIWGKATSFQEANAIELPYPWTRWHEPHGSCCFGCFYGEDGAVWEDFVRLAESAYLVLRQIDKSLPDDHFHGWMKVVHAMACGEPTPLLRSSSMVWQEWKCESAKDHERWITPKSGAPYPAHPVRRTLEHDVITSSMAAIERILDDEDIFPLEPLVPAIPEDNQDVERRLGALEGAFMFRFDPATQLSDREEMLLRAASDTEPLVGKEIARRAQVPHDSNARTSLSLLVKLGLLAKTGKGYLRAHRPRLS